MSFSFEAKNELCRLPVQKLCCARAEAYGILLYCNTFSASEVRIITGNPALAARLPKLFHRAFGLRFDRLPEEGESGKLVFQITDGGKLRRIVDLLGFSPEQNLALHINFGLLEEECCRASFLRGVFFAGGSVTDPAKRYHLELATSHLQVSRELEVLLRECGYPPKSVARNGSFITYFKQSDQIEDFLTLIGAPVAAMSVMSAKLEKDLRNSVNRRLNCDSANLDKAVEAAQAIPLDRLMIETDSPYMAPVPHRGERNDSGYVLHICEKLAQIKGVSTEECARITLENGKRFFRIGDPSRP